MIDLYHHDSSVCAAKVRFALGEKNLAWHGHYLDILKGDQFAPEAIEMTLVYFRCWHEADIKLRSRYGVESGHHRLIVSLSAFDVVDGTHSAASKCHRVVASKRNHIEGSRPWARLARSASISRNRCFRFTASMPVARW